MISNPLLILIIVLLLPALAHSFCFEEAGRLYGVSPRLLHGIARVESGLNPTAINRNRNGTVDLGLMQVNSFWLKTLGTSTRELIDKPCYNVMVGAWILSDCLDRHGKTWKAIGCYNATAHDKRVNYSWKIYRELQKAPRVAAAGSDRTASVSAQGGNIRTPPRPGDTETEVGLYGGINAYAAPIVSSIELTVTDKE